MRNGFDTGSAGTDVTTRMMELLTGPPLSRRRFVELSAMAGVFVAGARFPVRRLARPPVAAVAPSGGGAGAPRVYDLSIDSLGMHIDGRSGAGVAINGTVPGPLLRFREGEDVVIRVANRLAHEDTSIHWHGFLVPANMDGVPGFSFPGIRPGETFTYRFHVHQSGTYWYHSHSGGQEQQGVYGPIIIDPVERPAYGYDREYVVMLSDWSPESPEAIISHLKKDSSWYNRQRRTVPQFFRELFRARSAKERDAIIADRLMWARMRMDATDISDVTGTTYTYLMNGRGPRANWTALFRPGERVRLRFINGSAMTFFDVGIPGLRMTVVQADGQDVQPVVVDDFRIGVAETYDVIVEPDAGRAYTIFAQALDRSGYARGTLAERPGMTAPIPPMDPRPLRTMNMAGMDMDGMNMKGMDMETKEAPGQKGMPAGHAMPAQPGRMAHGVMAMGDSTRADSARARERVEAMPGMAGMPDMDKRSHQPGMAHGDSAIAATPTHAMQAAAEAAGNPGAGRRKLTYTDLRAVTPNPDIRPPERELAIHLTGDMWRYFWTIDGKKLSESKPVYMRLGERVRLRMINETMMDHPMHLHGVFMELQNGQPAAYAPRKHTVIVPPFETATLDITAIEPGMWAFHCHLLYHMMMGMFMRVIIEPARTAEGPVRLIQGGR